MVINPLMILVAGPYRSGTGDDPALIANNVAAMTDASLRLFRAGHLPVMGEWYALPLIEHAGSAGIGDPVFNEIFHRSRADCSPSAMLACGSAARRRAPMKWWRWPCSTGSLCTTRSSKYPARRRQIPAYAAEVGHRSLRAASAESGKLL